MTGPSRSLRMLVESSTMDLIPSSASSSIGISLGSMSQQALVQKPEDEWTGITDRERRRKLQNRLNQRAYRVRRQARKNSHLTVRTSGHVNESDENELLLSNNSIIGFPKPGVSPSNRFECTIAPPNAHEYMRELEFEATQNYVLGTPNIDHLLTLSKLNIQHAINKNIVAIGMTLEWLKSDESISIFSVACPSFSEREIPISLRPTMLQRTKPHHPWLDTFPFPQMRDNIIAVEEVIDDIQLCRDVMAFWDTRNTGAMLLVWGNPWDPKNWEVTEEFLQKWEWTIRGCNEILESTNAWRNLRGEQKLTWDC